MAKDLDALKWVEDLLPKNVIRKSMFGGFGYYVEGRLILTMFESPGDRSYKNLHFDFDIWNGCMFPVERVHHSQALAEFPILRKHPVLEKWLYIPLETEGFENYVESILTVIRRGSSYFGVFPKPKKKKAITTKSKKINLLVPQMFRDEPIEVKLKTAAKISDLKNLGPASEKQFKAAGIKSVSQFTKLGWQKTFKKLVKADPKNRHAVFAYALIGALKNIDWHQISEADKKAARDLSKQLK